MLGVQVPVAAAVPLYTGCCNPIGSARHAFRGQAAAEQVVCVFEGLDDEAADVAVADGIDAPATVGAGFDPVPEAELAEVRGAGGARYSGQFGELPTRPHDGDAHEVRATTTAPMSAGTPTTTTENPAPRSVPGHGPDGDQGVHPEDERPGHNGSGGRI